MDSLLAMRHCVQCGDVMEGGRQAKMYCSGRCRTAHYRGTPPLPLDEDDLFDMEVSFEMEKRLRVQP